MNDKEWTDIVRDLRDSTNVEVAVAAAERLHLTATLEDVPRLRQLLEDDAFFVREAVAWPLCELGGAAMLPDLFAAYQRGFDEGHDNDGFSTALIEFVEANRDAARDVLTLLARSSDAAVRENAVWLLEFCRNE